MMTFFGVNNTNLGIPDDYDGVRGGNGDGCFFIGIENIGNDFMAMEIRQLDAEQLDVFLWQVAFVLAVALIVAFRQHIFSEVGPQVSPQLISELFVGDPRSR